MTPPNVALGGPGVRGGGGGGIDLPPVVDTRFGPGVLKGVKFTLLGVGVGP